MIVSKLAAVLIIWFGASIGGAIGSMIIAALFYLTDVVERRPYVAFIIWTISVLVCAWLSFQWCRGEL